MRLNPTLYKSGYWSAEATNYTCKPAICLVDRIALITHANTCTGDEECGYAWYHSNSNICDNLCMYKFQRFQFPAFNADGFDKLEVKDQQIQTTGSMTKQHGVCKWSLDIKNDVCGWYIDISR